MLLPTLGACQGAGGNGNRATQGKNLQVLVWILYPQSFRLGCSVQLIVRRHKHQRFRTVVSKFLLHRQSAGQLDGIITAKSMPLRQLHRLPHYCRYSQHHAILRFKMALERLNDGRSILYG